MPPRYVIITPTKNEAEFIGQTIESVVSQTHRPTEWVIVSDGSTDRTNDIVRAAAASHSWIRLLALPPREERNFAAVVHATEAGVRELSAKIYDFIGLLDSDVRFQPDYFEKVLHQFKVSPRLGLAGGMVVDLGDSKTRLPRNREDVPGAVQFFRRSCFEGIGRLLAIPEGGWDGLTCAKARMIGYETRLFVELIVDHLKPRNISQGGQFRRKWQMGVRDYAVGYSGLFEAVKCLSRIGERPAVIGAICWFAGYCSAALQRRKRMIPNDLLGFLRHEQKDRLWQSLSPL